MIDARQWAKRLQAQLRESVMRDQDLDTGFLIRAEDAFRRVQLDAIRQCLLLAQQQMNASPARHRIGIGPVVDQIADLALDVKKRVTPKQGDA